MDVIKLISLYYNMRILLYGNYIMALFEPYDETKETISQYLQRAEDFKFQMTRIKYDVVLAFINELIMANDIILENPRKKPDRYLTAAEKAKLTPKPVPIKSLRLFKNVSEKQLFNNVDATREITHKYITIFVDQLGISLPKELAERTTCKFNTNNMTNDDTIVLLQHALHKLMTHSLEKTQLGKKFVYTIRVSRE